MYVTGLSAVGRVRSHNEDAIFHSTKPVGPLSNLFIIADGMGGHNAGEVASAKALEHSCDFLYKYQGSVANNAAELLNTLVTAINQANRDVYQLSVSNLDYSGMGTTFSACTVVGDTLAVAHIGDSRIYTFADGVLRQITNDHTMVQELLDADEITPDEARSHPRRNMLTKVLGCDPLIIAEETLHDINGVDSILLCSDGLTDMLTDETIQDILGQQAATDIRAEALIDAANANGGIDNISVIIIDLLVKKTSTVS
ncbi:MAG: Stp1/IreP family PP2C-type Ser/Thr phosphatase [Defluviitaleaceae bacterium]|nr:Stp1/IreP family PP2C-type Ser/Thr phosphatase [Defluviitaleaceae bacterium]